MGLSQKIFYFHLPLAWWGMTAFLLVFFASILYLCKKKMFWDSFARAAAETGVLFSALTLLTGMFWARPIWNVWWIWDPKLTTTLIMWFIYTAYLLVPKSGMSATGAPVIRAVLGVVAFLDIPLVFFAARQWRSVHPVVFASPGGGLETEMLLTLLVSIIAIGFLWLTLFLLRLAQLRNQECMANLVYKIMLK